MVEKLRAAPASRSGWPYSLPKVPFKFATQIADMHTMRLRRLLLVLGLLASFAYAATEWHGKDCHFNVHLAKRVYCTESSR